MKKLILFAISCVAIFAYFGCSKSTPQAPPCTATDTICGFFCPDQICR